MYLPIAFFHEIEGRGFPSALQSIVISFPKIVLLSNGSDDHLGGSFLFAHRYQQDKGDAKEQGSHENG